MDGNAGHIPNTIKTVRYFDNYKDILTRIANTSEYEYIWIISSCCDYTNFDFSWHPDNTSEPYIYAWGNQWNQPEDKTSVNILYQGPFNIPT